MAQVLVRPRKPNGDFDFMHKNQPCTKCKSKTSRTRRGPDGKIYTWGRINGRWYCLDCYHGEYYRLMVNPNVKRHLKSLKVCSRCGSTETNKNAKGCPCWHNINGKRYCASCYEKVKRLNAKRLIF